MTCFRAFEAATDPAPPWIQKRHFAPDCSLGSVTRTAVAPGLVPRLLSSAFWLPGRLCRVSICEDVSVNVHSVLYGAGGGLPLYQGVLLGADGDQGVRRDGLLADAPGRRGAHPSPVWQRREPVFGRSPPPTLGKRPAVDGTVLHRGAGKAKPGPRRTGEPNNLRAGLTRPDFTFDYYRLTLTLFFLAPLKN